MISKPITNNNQIIPQKKLEFATITKITTNINLNKKINQMNLEEDQAAKVIKLSEDENNNNKEIKEEEIKIKKETTDNNIPNTNFKLNPRVRFAKEEK